jgi:hypothetical protein
MAVTKRHKEQLSVSDCKDCWEGNCEELKEEESSSNNKRVKDVRNPRSEISDWNGCSYRD